MGKSATLCTIKYEIKGAVKSPFGFILMKTNFFKYSFLILSVLIMVFIFIMSHQNADVSSSQSGGVIESIAKIFVRDFDKLSQSSQQAIIDSYQHFVRKAAHFSIYAALSLFLRGYFVISDFFKKGYNAAFTFFVALLYCCTDEVHQYFIPGRSCQVTDIFIDSLGIICGILVFQLFYLLFKKRGVASEK